MGTLAAVGAMVGAGGVSAYVVPNGGLLSLTVADSTAIDPISSIGPSGDGWVASVVLKNITSLVGTVDPTKLSITVSDPGYDTSGNATTVSRTITGVAHVRRQYPNGASKMISTDGTHLTLLISLDDWIYSGTTIVSASIASGFYTGSAASNAGTKTNSSTLAYAKPLFGWINRQLERTTDTHAVEAVAFHRHATAGQQVACIKFKATDGTHDSAVVTTASTALSALVTQGNIPEVWKASVDMSGIDQGLATINATVYPWLGDAPLDVAVDGVAWPTSLPITPLKVYCDRTGAYGGAYAYVDGTGAGTPAVSATPATAKANPYATIAAALTAVKAWNNTNKSHNDIGGAVVRLMDDGAGGAKTHTIAAASVNSPGATYCVVEKDPDTAATVTVTWSAGNQRQPQLMLWRNLRMLLGASTYGLIGNSTAREIVALDGVTVDNTAAKTFIADFALKYLHNLTFSAGTVGFSGIATFPSNIAIMAGCVGSYTAGPAASTTSLPNDGKLMIGNVIPGYYMGSTANTGGDGDHGRINYNNRCLAMACSKTTINTLNYGWANIQNLCENDTTQGTGTFHQFADGDLTTITNLIDMHNTGVGERCSRMYNDVVACDVIPNGIIKAGVSKYSLYDNYNIKDDRFSTGAGSVGAWAYGYGVGNVGNVSLFGAVQRLATDVPHNDNADTPYLGSAWLSSSEYNLFRTALGYTQAQIMAMFTNYTVKPQAVAAVGGNYIPLSTATHIKSRVPTGKSVLKYDIAGTLRNTDGTGAAGAYEAAT